MRLTKTILVVEIAVVLILFVGVEWLAHIFIGRRETFVWALLFWIAYLSLRTAISARTRRARDTRHSN